jgi:hypothetical protein
VGCGERGGDHWPPAVYNKSSDEREQLPLGFPGDAKKEEGRVTRGISVKEKNLFYGFY